VTTHPLSPSRLVYGFSNAADPRVSPSGTRIAHVIAETSQETHQTTSHLWVRNIDGANPCQLTWTGRRNGLPRWSPDGRSLTFVSDRTDPNAIFVLSMEGGEPRQVLAHPTTITDLAWSPDGASIAFTAPFDPINPAAAKPAEGEAPAVRVTSRLDYKQDNRGYLGDARTQVFVADVATGEHRMVTGTPVDHNFPAWSPDGALIAVQVPNRNGMCSQLALVPARGGEVRVFGPELGVVATWAWSPDGRTIALTGDTEQTWQTDFFLLDVASGSIRRITTDLECLPVAGFPTIEPPSQPVWLDDHRLLFHAVRSGASGLYTIDLQTGAVEQVEGAQSLRSGLSTDSAHRYVVQGLASLDSVGEIHVFDRQDGTARVITRQSAPVFESTPPARWERFDVQRDGLTIEAWLLTPPGFDPAKKYPVVLDVHGGPNGFYGYGFNNVQQLLATNGFALLFCNPRGSSSYGRDFTLRVAKDWGGEDYRDLLAVVDAALGRPYLDPERVGIYGYSYGGYITAWAISQSNRFKAAVCGAPCFDLESMFGTSDISHHFGVLQWGGAPHEDREWYATHSPSQFAHNTRTPTLIIHGEADERCPIGQGEQMFVTLKKAGCEVEFARYPGGSHLLQRVGPPEHRADVLTRTLAWFKTHLGEPMPA
jgi:dipeptidyl aminopeptidase/acylaminoacyl peptidase